MKMCEMRKRGGVDGVGEENEKKEEKQGKVKRREKGVVIYPQSQGWV